MVGEELDDQVRSLGDGQTNGKLCKGHLYFSEIDPLGERSGPKRPLVHYFHSSSVVSPSSSSSRGEAPSRP